MAKIKTLRLTYLSVKEMRNAPSEPKAQPCVVHPDGRTPFRVVPITPIIRDVLEAYECLGCVGQHGSEKGNDLDCSHLPDCANTIYVRATPANKLKHIEWLLERNN